MEDEEPTVGTLKLKSVDGAVFTIDRKVIQEEGQLFFKTLAELDNEDEENEINFCDAETLEAVVSFLNLNHEHPMETIKDPRDEELKTTLEDNIVQEQYRDYLSGLFARGGYDLVFKVRKAAVELSLEQLMLLAVVWLSFQLTDEYTTPQLHGVLNISEWDKEDIAKARAEHSWLWDHEQFEDPERNPAEE